MGIFSTSLEVIKNKDNFKRWEDEQRLEEAKREKLYQSKQYSEEELEKARALGENIINAIDVMDNHSESVAENVETATEPIVGLAPMIGLGIGGWASFKFLINPAAKKINDIQQRELNTDTAKKLYQEIQNSFGKEQKYFSLTSKRHIKKIKDPTLKKQAENFYNNLSKQTSLYKKSYWLAGALTLGSLLTAFMGSIIGATKLQVNSSKVARYQARRELEDPKYFVNYTPEQIAQAQADLKEAKESKKKGLFKKRNKEENKKTKLRQGFLGSLFGLIRDNKKYRLAKKQESNEVKIVTRELTAEELIQAEKDKEIIQRTVRIINNEAEKNSENMETAANVIIGGTPFLGIAVGSFTSWILNKTGIVDKAINRSIEKNASDTTKNLLAEYKKVEANKNLKGVSGLIKKCKSYFEYVGSTLDDLEKSQPIKNGIRQKAKPSDWFKRGSTAILTSAKGRNWIFGLIGGFMTGIAGLIIGLKLQKSAARAGRYTAKRELEKDPRNFIGYTQEEYDEVQDVKPVQKESRFKEVVLFIPKVLKQYFEYNKYKKNEFKEKEELRKYLHKQEISEQQLKEAKNLQRKVFNTFEKVDDNSQKYSESMEAAIEIAQPFVVFGGYIAALTPFVLAIIGLVKAKENPAKIIEKITNWMKNGSKITNSKLTKKYLEGVSRNVSCKTAEVSVNNKLLANLFKDVDWQKDKKLDIVDKILKNLPTLPNDLRKLPKNEIENQINNVYKALQDIKIKEEPLLNKFGLEEKFKEILNLPTDKKIDALENFLKSESFKNINIKNMVDVEIPFTKLFKEIDIKKLLPDYLKDPSKGFAKLKEITEKTAPEELDKFISNIPYLRNIKGLDKKTLVKILDNLEHSINNIPKAELEKIKNSIIEEFNKNPDEFVKLVRTGKLKSIFLTPELQKTLTAVGIAIPTFTIAMTYMIESWLAGLQLKAGRLGVMKSLEELEDSRYYANIES